MADSGWWNPIFSRSKCKVKVQHEPPPESCNNSWNKGHPNLPQIPTDPLDNQCSARLEKEVDKTKGWHVKVSRSGRLKEKKKVCGTLAENPMLITECGPNQEKHRGDK
ncbi:proline-rich protein 15-like protein B [Esox lucius]|uniref:Uncharacterized protein n=1 Tax=Esox lucius TaxID=8010 RepID=A0AAY5JZS8_ESOLU|nr:proline-rich protein 15-like protein B [Esox lucius]